METTWDMSPAKRKMFIVAASFVVVRARPPGNYSAVFGAVFILPWPAAGCGESLRRRRRVLGLD